MANPRVKRTFAGAASDPAQRQITNFFGRDLDYEPGLSSSSRPGCEHRSSSPLLPPSVQANLLAVGMRVRKSVPEGYKTKGMDGPSARPTAATGTAYKPSYSSCNVAHPTPALSQSTSATQRELTPFCGLHKVGGLGVQTFGDDEYGQPLFSASVFNGGDGLADGAELPGLSSSQETVSSAYSCDSTLPSRFDANTVPSFSSTRKRFYDEGEEEEEEDGVEDEFETGMEADAGVVYRPDYGRSFKVHEDAGIPLQVLSRVSPFSGSLSSSFVSGWLTSGNAGRRALANPRRRQQPSQAPLKAPGSLYSFDQENVKIMGDFDEADFLDASVLAQGGDMQMGGV
ncbi:hypothetical protein SEPCBS57363_005472 [Sporothrix epigloea]|uniref:Uncharacterized protein n=1 Tax=Sporothrix epigloea TaxID=1892477 RepID=A0ABP0DXQ4_9PEZI